jgi:magnesium-transporting ATPase (P-type)
MTGDGVNDAPALSAAQCGIAVDDATDAAKGAAAMILTTEGLSAVFTAILESRKIFNRLFSYIAYRLASTIQILIYLSVLVYVFNCKVNPLYVILLALFNDITMIPVAEDRQTASAAPQHANVGGLIGFSMLLGVMQTLVSMVYYLCLPLGGLVKNLDKDGNFGYPSNTHAQNAIWLQVSIAAELLIFAARAPGFFFLSRPAVPLFVSTMLGNIISIILGVWAFEDGLDGAEVLIIIGWDLAALFIVDCAKLLYKYVFEYSVRGIIDEAQLALEDSQPEQHSGSQARDDLGLSGANPSRQTSSLAGSVVDFLSTGKAPYASSMGNCEPHSNDSVRTASLHRRTPAILAQERSVHNSVQRQSRSF